MAETTNPTPVVPADEQTPEKGGFVKGVKKVASAPKRFWNSHPRTSGAILGAGAVVGALAYGASKVNTSVDVQGEVVLTTEPDPAE